MGYIHFLDPTTFRTLDSKAIAQAKSNGLGGGHEVHKLCFFKKILDFKQKNSVHARPWRRS